MPWSHHPRLGCCLSPGQGHRVAQLAICASVKDTTRSCESLARVARMASGARAGRHSQPLAQEGACASTHSFFFPFCASSQFTKSCWRILSMAIL